MMPKLADISFQQDLLSRWEYYLIEIEQKGGKISHQRDREDPFKSSYFHISEDEAQNNQGTKN